MKNRKSKVYLAFIDFRKFYSRKYLLYKMLGLNITGKFYNIIKTMYSSCQYHVKTPHGVTPAFPSDSGVRQGCNLSPTLANIFQNDIHDIFQNDCDPVRLGDIDVNSMSWADDLVLMSTTAIGLQRCLDRIQGYCHKWSLQVNKVKTKCMIFRSRLNTTINEQFKYDGHTLENVDKYTYLGIDLSANGNYKAAIKARISKANRAAFMLRQAISTTGNVNVKLALNLYEKQIVPILTYGCAIWGVPTPRGPTRTNHLYIDNIDTDINITTIRKHIAEVCGHTVQLDLVRKVKAPPEQASPHQGASVLVKFSNITDKESYIRQYRAHTPDGNTTRIIHRDADMDTKHFPYERNHDDFCKFTLNMTKYSSTEACRGELGRFPVSNKIWCLAAKYWLRLEQGTPNLFLNEAYKDARNENHPWYQSIKHIIYTNGFGFQWENPHQIPLKSFGKQFQQRLNDQHIQKWKHAINKNKAFKYCIPQNNEEYILKSYLNEIHDTETRQILTRLRLDKNKLNTCQGKYNNIPYDLRTCPHCPNTIESVEHFIAICPHYTIERDSFKTNISMNTAINRDIGALILYADPPLTGQQRYDFLKFACIFLKSIYDKR